MKREEIEKIIRKQWFNRGSMMAEIIFEFEREKMGKSVFYRQSGAGTTVLKCVIVFTQGFVFMSDLLVCYGG